eukprot:5649390-Pleurochrysis_carterae.AAC.1
MCVAGGVSARARRVPRHAAHRRVRRPRRRRREARAASVQREPWAHARGASGGAARARLDGDRV